MTIRSLVLLVAILACISTGDSVVGNERPTFNHTCDPRPDILPYWIHNSKPEYRRVYNRPRYWGGWVAAQIAPTSQEAMVWEENLRAGAYNEHHSPPRYKRYYYPKPWEVLQTGARPDFPPPESNAAQPLTEEDRTQFEVEAEIETVPAPLTPPEPSPSDR